MAVKKRSTSMKRAATRTTGRATTAAKKSAAAKKRTSTLAKPAKKRPSAGAKAAQKTAGRKTTTPRKGTPSRRTTTARQSAPAKSGVKRTVPKKSATPRKAAASATATTTSRKAPASKTATKPRTARKVAPARNSNKQKGDTRTERPNRSTLTRQVEERTANRIDPSGLRATAEDNPHEKYAQDQIKQRSDYYDRKNDRSNGNPPGQTAAQGFRPDRRGSQPERKRHQYPNANIPNRGSARSAQYKGKPRTDGPLEE